MIDELIAKHVGYAHAIAAELAGKYPPNITRADLEGAAEYGLVQAAHSYDPSRNISFTTFAYYRVRGAIIDEVRKSCRASNLGTMNGEFYLEDEKGQLDIAGGVILSRDAEAGNFSSAGIYPRLDVAVDLESVPDTRECPSCEFIRKEGSEILLKAISQLPSRHRFILQSYYYDEMSMVDISRELHLSKSRISRIHAQALAMVRSIL